MKPLRISGAMKVAAGITTLAEVFKVAPPVAQPDRWSPAAARAQRAHCSPTRDGKPAAGSPGTCADKKARAHLALAENLFGHPALATAPSRTWAAQGCALPS